MDLPPNKLTLRKGSSYATASHNYQRRAQANRDAKENNTQREAAQTVSSASTSVLRSSNASVTKRGQEKLSKPRNTPPRKRAPNTTGNSGANSDRKKKGLAMTFLEPSATQGAVRKEDAHNVSVVSGRKSSFVERQCMSFDKRSAGGSKAGSMGGGPSQGGLIADYKETKDTKETKLRPSASGALYSNLHKKGKSTFIEGIKKRSKDQ